MDLLPAIPYLIGAWLLWKAIQFGYLWFRMLGVRFTLPITYSRREQTELPPALQPIFTAAEQALIALGLPYSHMEASDTGSPSTSPAFLQVYSHPEAHTYAVVTPALLPGSLAPFDVEFVTFLSNGEAIATIDQRQDLVLPTPPWYHLHDAYLGHFEQQWQAHQDRLRHLPSTCQPLPYTPEAAAAYRHRFSQDSLAHLRAIGWLIPAPGAQQWRCHPRHLGAWVWRILAGNKKRTALGKARRQTPALEQPAHLAADVAAFTRLVESDVRPQRGWIAKSLAFLSSVVAFAVVFGLNWSWSNVLLLCGVLLVHELGHLSGMMWCGYHDRQILFVPFLGAVTLGRKDDATPMQKVIIYLLGPVPGLVFGLVGLHVFATTSGTMWWSLSLMALIVNYLNLLPFLPLDGGRVVEALFLGRLPRARFVFQLLSTVLLLLAAVWAQDKVLIGVAVLMSLALPTQWRWGSAARRLRRTLPAQADRQTRLQTVFQVLAQAPFHRQSVADRVNMAKSLLEYCSVPAPTLAIILLGSLLYGAALAGPIYYGATLFLPRAEGNAWLPSFSERLFGTPRAEPPDLELTPQYACPCTGEPETLRPLEAQVATVPWVSVIGTFDQPEMLQRMVRTLQQRTAPSVRTTVFGQSVVATLPGDQHDEITSLRQAILDGGGTALVEDADEDKRVLVSLICTTTDEAIAQQTFAHLQNYFDMAEDFHLRAPWAPTDDLSTEQQQAYERARATYQQVAAYEQQQWRAFRSWAKEQGVLRPGQPGDNKSRDMLRQAQKTYESNIARAMTEAFRTRDDATLDLQVVDLYVQRLQHDGPEESPWDTALAQRLGRVAFHNDVPGEYAAMFSATAFDVRQDGRILRFPQMIFEHTAVGLPAFIQYLCTQTCGNVTYAVADFSQARRDLHRD